MNPPTPEVAPNKYPAKEFLIITRISDKVSEILDKILSLPANYVIVFLLEHSPDQYPKFRPWITAYFEAREPRIPGGNSADSFEPFEGIYDDELGVDIGRQE